MKVGDLVQLKGGKRKMTVTDVRIDGIRHIATCSWEVKGGFETQSFQIEALEPYKNPGPPEIGVRVI